MHRVHICVSLDLHIYSTVNSFLGIILVLQWILWLEGLLYTSSEGFATTQKPCRPLHLLLHALPCAMLYSAPPFAPLCSYKQVQCLQMFCILSAHRHSNAHPVFSFTLKVLPSVNVESCPVRHTQNQKKCGRRDKPATSRNLLLKTS